MAEAKLAILLCMSMVTLLVLSVIQNTATAENIQYPTMNRDHVPGNPQLNHPGANANIWTRGCEKIEHCRDNM
uniref:Uncharacterized protein n=1 Tax=Leersia perrieri TaxID=77586 RepID=A0A0D9WX26_9ORYZ